MRHIAVLCMRYGIRNENDRSIGLFKNGAPLWRVRSSRASAAQTPNYGPYRDQLSRFFVA